jgi:ABC-type glycerol-3-phosphate transport system substrate-binding protein
MTLANARRLLALLAVGIALAIGGHGASAQTTIRFMGWVGLFDFQKAGWERIVADFQAANPGVRIEYVGTPFAETLNQLTIAIVGRNAPDVMQVQSVWVPQLQGIGGLAALDALIPAADLAQYPALEPVSANGHPYALPWIPGPIVMAYNRNLLRQAGLDPDRPPATWPALTEAMRRVCALPPRDGNRIYGAALRTSRNPNSAQWAIPVIWGFGGDIVNAQGRVDVTSDGTVRAFEWYREVVLLELQPRGVRDRGKPQRLRARQRRLRVRGPLDPRPDQFDVGRTPARSTGRRHLGGTDAGRPDGRVRQIANSNMLAVSEQSQHKELAARFVRFILENRPTVEYFAETSQQLTTGRMDVLTSGSFANDPYAQIFVRSLAFSDAVPIRHPRWNAMMDVLAPALQNVIAGNPARPELERAARDIQRLVR